MDRGRFLLLTLSPHFGTAANGDGLTNLSSSKSPLSAIIVHSLKLKSDRYGLSRGHHDDGARADHAAHTRPRARTPSAKDASLLRAHGRLCGCRRGRRVQEALVKAIEAFWEQNIIANVEAWLFRVAHNAALD